MESAREIIDLQECMLLSVESLMGGLVTFPHMALKAGTVTQSQFNLCRLQNNLLPACVFGTSN